MTTTALAQDNPSSSPIRVGIIGLDTSHVVAFTRALNDPKANERLARAKIVAGFAGGSDDIASSRERVAGFTEQLKAMNVEICETIPALLEKCDAVMLESVDGRPHLEQVLPVFRSGKRVFIDKPLAGSLVDVLAIKQLGEKYNVPWFSSSSLRFSPGIIKFRSQPLDTGKVLGAVAWSPCSLEPTHPDLFWYGVHGVESLFTIMGQGCQQVSRVHTKDADQAIGVWSDGRIGTFHGMRAGKTGYGGVVFCEKEIAQAGPFGGYEPLVDQIVEFFATGITPVKADETVEIFAFMTAADASKENGCKPVALAEVMTAARTAVAERLKELGE